MKCVGIDPSTCTGLAMVSGDHSVGKTVVFPKARGWERVQLIAQEVERTLTLWTPDVILIEGYAYGNRGSLVTLVEIGSIIRSVLWKTGVNWLECPPTVLKKWTTGKGNAKKPEMAQAVKVRWGYESPSDDIVDAFALAKLGEHLHVNGITPDVRGIVPGR